MLGFPASAEKSVLADSVARPQSMRSAGLIDGPLASTLSAYRTLVPEMSTLDSTRCAVAPGGEKLQKADGEQTRDAAQTQSPIVITELAASNSSELEGANRSSVHVFPSTMNAYS
jgi:hypothetical protein